MSSMTHEDDDQRTDATSLSKEGRAAFKRLYDEFGDEDAVGQIAATVLQSADEADDNEATNS